MGLRKKQTYIRLFYLYAADYLNKANIFLLALFLNVVNFHQVYVLHHMYTGTSSRIYKTLINHLMFSV